MDTITTQEAAGTLQAVPVDLQDCIEDAQDLVGAMHAAIDVAAMPPALAQLWQASIYLAHEHPNTRDRHTFPVRVAHVLALNALIGSPDAVMAALRHLRAELVRLDPELAHIAN